MAVRKPRGTLLSMVSPVWVALLVYALVLFTSFVDPDGDEAIGGLVVGGLLALAAIFAFSQRLRNLEDEVTQLRESISQADDSD